MLNSFQADSSYCIPSAAKSFFEQENLAPDTDISLEGVNVLLVEDNKDVSLPPSVHTNKAK